MEYKKKANGYAVILSIIIIIIFTYFNRKEFNDINIPQVIIFVFSFFEFIFIAGVLESISKTYNGVIDILAATLVAVAFYYMFLRQSDFGKMVIIILGIIPLYITINGFGKIYKNLALSDKGKKTSNIILMVFQVTSFILAVLQLLQIFKVV